MCVFDFRIFDTNKSSYDGRQPQKSCLRISGSKIANILRLYLRDSATSSFVLPVDRVTEEEIKGATMQLSAYLSKNGIKNNRKHMGIPGTISP